MKNTLVLKVNPDKPEKEIMQISAGIIKKGGIVAFPTETVYGLGADAFNPKAVRALFEAKKRPLDNPPIIHIEKTADLYKLARNVPPETELLMKCFWPGPLTLVLKRLRAVPEVTVAGLDTVAVRAPKHQVALALIRESGCPIAAPSANLAGKPSPTTAAHVLEDLNGRIDAILDAGPTRVGVESTVLDMSTSPPQILRPGGTTLEVLCKVLGNVKLHPFVAADKEIAIGESRSPGMKHKHYAPKAKLILVEGNISAVAEKINEIADVYRQKGCKVGILSTDENETKYEGAVVKSLGSRFNLDAIAQNLFRLLREFDAESVEVIIAEGLPSEGIGLAVMNRLRKASGYNIIMAMK